MTFDRSLISKEEAKAFVLSAVALSAGIFNVAFWYGVFDTVFFEQLFFVWVASVVALITSMLVPPVDALPAFVSWRGRFVLVLPSIWLVLEALMDPGVSVTVFDEWTLWLLSISVVLITLPYLIYVLILVTVPDIDRLTTPTLRLALFAIALAIGIAGLAIGKNHATFLTCADFKVAGDDVPENCRPARLCVPKTLSALINLIIHCYAGNDSLLAPENSLFPCAGNLGISS